MFTCLATSFFEKTFILGFEFDLTKFVNEHLVRPTLNAQFVARSIRIVRFYCKGKDQKYCEYQKSEKQSAKRTSATESFEARGPEMS